MNFRLNRGNFYFSKQNFQIWCLTSSMKVIKNTKFQHKISKITPAWQKNSEGHGVKNTSIASQYMYFKERFSVALIVKTEISVTRFFCIMCCIKNIAQGCAVNKMLNEMCLLLLKIFQMFQSGESVVCMKSKCCRGVHYVRLNEM